jgi:hypothetical protein
VDANYEEGVGMPITADDLHEAADALNYEDTFEQQGFAPGALEEFINAARFYDSPGPNPKRLDIDSLSLAYGIGIGIRASSISQP